MRSRLTFPGRFGSEKKALGYIRDNSLFPIGAVALAVDDGPRGWRIAIDTAKPDAVQRYLGQFMPGVAWQRSELE